MEFPDDVWTYIMEYLPKPVEKYPYIKELNNIIENSSNCSLKYMFRITGTNMVIVVKIVPKHFMSVIATHA